MLLWDYNLAFGTYSLGMPNPINDFTLYVNYPINTPALGEIMMKNKEYFAEYYEYFDFPISEYFESGYFDDFIKETSEMISPYVKNDPTSFCSYEDYLLAVDTIKNFCLLRAESVQGQLTVRFLPLSGDNLKIKAIL